MPTVVFGYAKNGSLAVFNSRDAIVSDVTASGAFAPIQLTPLNGIGVSSGPVTGAGNFAVVRLFSITGIALNGLGPAPRATNLRLLKINAEKRNHDIQAENRRVSV